MVTLTDSSVTLEGHNKISGNSASVAAGGIAISERSTVIINGGLCATSNTAAEVGGFAVLDAARNTLLFSKDSVVHFGDNTPDTVAVAGPGTSSVQCGANSPSWGTGAGSTSVVSFNITGAACACNEIFVSSTEANQTCDGCNGIPWSPSRCACVSAILPACCAFMLQSRRNTASKLLFNGYRVCVLFMLPSIISLYAATNMAWSAASAPQHK